MWQSIVCGIGFLTILPGGRTMLFDARRTVSFFPVCGLLIGTLLVMVDVAAASFWQRPAAAVIDVVALAVISGALHLDGLADTADGLYGRRTLQRALEIMKDSRIGSIGTVAVACCLAVKWAGISGLHADRLVWLLLVPAFARGAVLFGIRTLPYGRPEGGTGHVFFQQPLRMLDFWGLAVLSGLAFLCTGWQALWIVGGFAFLAFSVLLYYRRKINCITGDMLGALIEIEEAGLFLLLSALNTSN
ncbi:MAG: adenosylcobinamide-GDP ribazoletransferase [Desulfobacteraceae bacterium]|nr:MAG: adenosylcobinamide-GDP ribazoletransferase [Desulfobacteraceae bacterium]